ncbi:NUDIX domain-containing protein [Thalassiella azotivora]
MNRPDGPDEPLRDALAPRPVVRSQVVHQGLVWDVVRDTVDLGDAGTVDREYVRHPGAVGILALDERERVLLVRQYRHPVQHDLWELPAGLLDVEGEAPVEAARRELAEEADTRAGRWHVLVDWFNSPGGMDEAIRVFLARDLDAVPHNERFEREHEEADMVTAWVPLDELRDAVLGGRLHNPTTVVGVLAACAARDAGWASLRPCDAPWQEHKAYR